MNAQQAKEACLQALHSFIEESSNENKMELHLAYEDIEDADKAAVLGEELNEAIARIIHQNYHPDSYLNSLGQTFFA